MKMFSLADIESERADSSAPYFEFLRVPSMSAGIYILPARSQDRQSPHSEDELYLVRSGRAKFKSGSEDIPVSAGTVLFVAAGEEHRFHSIEEDLMLLVFFAPAEYNAAECPE